MRKLKYSLIVLVLFVVIESTNGMSVKQLEAAVKLVRNVCLPKTKATMEDVEKMHRGDWDIDHTAMCYMWCSLNTYKLMNKENKFDYDSGMAQLKTVPDVYKESSKKCMIDCKDSPVTLDDKCVAAYEFAKCIYFCSPETYYLP